MSPISFPYDVSPVDCYEYVANHTFPADPLYATSAGRIRPGSIVGIEGRPAYVVLDWASAPNDDNVRTFPVVFTPDGGIGIREFPHNDETIPVLGHVPHTPADTF